MENNNFDALLVERSSFNNELARITKDFSAKKDELRQTDLVIQENAKEIMKGILREASHGKRKFDVSEYPYESIRIVLNTNSNLSEDKFNGEEGRYGYHRIIW